MGSAHMPPNQSLRCSCFEDECFWNGKKNRMRTIKNILCKLRVVYPYGKLVHRRNRFSKFIPKFYFWGFKYYDRTPGTFIVLDRNRDFFVIFRHFFFLTSQKLRSSNKANFYQNLTGFLNVFK